MTEPNPSTQAPLSAEPDPSSSGPPADETQGRRQQVSAYAQGSVANMLRSLLVIGAIMALLVIVFPRAQPVTPDIDVLETAQQVEQSTGWPISAPRDLPEEWVSTRAQYLRSTDSLMTWQAAYQTPAGDYAALQETVDATDAWVTAQVNRSPRVGQLEVAGTTWDQYNRDGKVQRSLVRRGEPGEVTTVVTGTASFEELQVLVESLETVRATS
ncbi:MAG: DUF4245 domain-containing protein [Dermatophilaceae bacterium]|nr:DUF4245 domain-containing protein [Intrasporangiaceae bacterium]